MRLVKCVSTSPDVTVICLACSRPLKHSEAWADLAGAPFQAYYHADHKPDADSVMYQAGRKARRDGAPAPGEYCVEGDAYRAGWYDADEDDAHDRALETGSATLRDAQP